MASFVARPPVMAATPGQFGQGYAASRVSYTAASSATISSGATVVNAAGGLRYAASTTAPVVRRTAAPTVVSSSASTVLRTAAPAPQATSMTMDQYEAWKAGMTTHLQMPTSTVLSPAQSRPAVAVVQDGMRDRGKGRGRVYENVVEAIGNTPCIKINEKLCPPGRTIYAKCEFFNPLSSVKDRLAAAIIEDGEAQGLLKPGDTVVEATSGNTGIALAMLCAQRGYNCVVTMAEPFSVERRKLMRMLGAKVIITPKAAKGSGMVKKAAELAEAHGWFACRQFENQANTDFHYKTTGPEIVADFAGMKLDYFVLGYGTGGTFAGAGKYIKERRPEVKICLSEPEAAQMLTSGQPQERKPDGSPESSHPAFTAHPIQGWAPDFIPLVLENGTNDLAYDELLTVPGPAAIETAQALARTQGILTGISGGASMWTAIEMAKKAPEGSVLVCIIADTGERYLSTPLFASIEADMNAEELEISQSTPNFQLG